MKTIHIDIGGTFTDAVVTLDEKQEWAKAATTTYDFSVCFMNAIEEAAKKLGLSLSELLPQVEITGYATTVAMNRLIERTGPRLGLITTEGHEDAVLIGNGPQWVDGIRPAERRNLANKFKPAPLIPRELIVGVKERIGSRGDVIRPLDEEDVRQKSRYLVSKGIRGFVVSLLWSILNPAHELRVREIIRDEYKEYHVGYLPVVLAHQVADIYGEYKRTMTAIIDAYLQRLMQIEFSATWDKLREQGYKGSILIVHNSGGCADLFKTAASRTYNGGPVAGLIGASVIARQLGYRNVVASDVGGTSFDVGLVVEHPVRTYDFRPIIDCWQTATSMIQTKSIGAGGGSIARLNEVLGNKLEIGPQSAGAFPGPACYALGGTEPTVTDADLVLGYLNPNYHHGGRIKLHPDLAVRAIKRKIADKLGVSVEEAAMAIRKIADGNMGSAIRKEVFLRGYRADEFLLFSYGGGGPTHVAGYMGDIPKAIVFPFSPVFSAVGESLTDVVHIFEKTNRMLLLEPMTKKVTVDFDSFNRTVEALIDRANSDLMAMGLPLEKASYVLELDMLYGGQINVKRALSPKLFLKSEADALELYQSFEQEFTETFSSLAVNPLGGVIIDNFIVRAVVPVEKGSLPTYRLEKPDADYAKKEARDAFWEEKSGFFKTPIYEYEALRPGNVIEGPAIAEAADTTLVIPPGMMYSVDRHGLGVLEKAK